MNAQDTKELQLQVASMRSALIAIKHHPNLHRNLDAAERTLSAIDCIADTALGAMEEWQKKLAERHQTCSLCACNVYGRTQAALRKLMDAKDELDDLMKLTAPSEPQENCPD